MKKCPTSVNLVIYGFSVEYTIKKKKNHRIVFIVLKHTLYEYTCIAHLRYHINSWLYLFIFFRFFPHFYNVRQDEIFG